MIKKPIFKVRKQTMAYNFIQWIDSEMVSSTKLLVSTYATTLSKTTKLYLVIWKK